MTAPIANGVTDNASVQVDPAVTRNECAKCEDYQPPENNKRWSWRGLHCTNCHSARHVACVQCDACLPAGHRYDRRYCSASCRAKAHQARRQAQLDREVWEAENPAEAAAMEAADRKNSEDWVEVIGKLDTRSAEVKARQHQHGKARERAEVCADCTSSLNHAIIYRRFNGRLGQDRGEAGPIVVPVCPSCRCPSSSPHRTNLCDKCRPSGRTWDWIQRTHHSKWTCPDAGTAHVGEFCSNCHPSAWRDVKPCEGCDRPVANHITVRRGYRADVELDDRDPSTAWVRWKGEGYGWYDVPIADVTRTFCSEACRRQIFQAERKAKRQAERDTSKTCPVCRTPFVAQRTDTRYCSSACRQQAYRQRQADRNPPPDSGKPTGGAV